MDIYEQSVLEYISAPLWRFVNPQMALPGESCPDFVALDFKLNTVHVVEVTAAANAKLILGRVSDRKNRWYQSLRALLKENASDLFAEWEYRVAIFVREDVYEHVCETLKAETDVSVIHLESAFQGWKWNWGERNMNPLE